MRWITPTKDQLHEQRKAKLALWNRHFAWRPIMCTKTRCTFWLEFVWVRGFGEYRYRSHFHFRNADWKCYDYEELEVRGGWRYPELRQPLPGQTSTVV